MTLEEAANEQKLLYLFKTLTVASLKTLCKEIPVKSSSNKAQLIGQLVTYWERFFSGLESEEDSAKNSKRTKTLPDINAIHQKRYLKTLRLVPEERIVFVHKTQCNQ